MTARIETVGDCKILHVGGRIDFESSLDFEQQVNSMIQSGGGHFVIELSEVELLSSAGLRVLLSTAKRVQHRHAELALASPSPVVLQVFRISHFDLLFKIFTTLQEALAAFGVSGSLAAVKAGTEEVVADKGKTNAAREEISSPPINESVAQPSRVKPPSLSEIPLRPPPVVQEPPPAVTQPSSPVESKSLAEIARPVVPPPLPIPVPRTEDRASAGTSTPPPVPMSVSADRPRREASYPAVLEIRAEGISYPCKDGDVIGTAGRVANSFFASIAGLEARHLLIGQEGDRWFIFTPKNIAHPFVLDGVLLVAGERKFLQYVEHQMEFNGHVFGLRLIPDRRKKGIFGRPSK
jgi:anti-sigma B factor antagonist